MKKLILLLTILAFYGCNKPKSVFICGDHVCVNKAEAEQYFEDYLTLEVRVIDKKKSKELDYGDQLAGNVMQEFKLEDDFM